MSKYGAYLLTINEMARIFSYNSMKDKLDIYDVIANWRHFRLEGNLPYDYCYLLPIIPTESELALIKDISASYIIEKIGYTRKISDEKNMINELKNAIKKEGEVKGSLICFTPVEQV